MNKDTVIEEILDKVNQDITSTRTNIDNLKASIDKLLENRRGLLSSIELIKDEGAIQVLKEGLVSIEKDIDAKTNLYHERMKDLEYLQKSKSYILHILQSICTHSEREEDHYDYHRNIYYEKCIYCGKGKL